MTNNEMQIKALEMLLVAKDERVDCFELYQGADSAESKEVWMREFINRTEREQGMRDMCIELFGLDRGMLCLRRNVEKLIDELTCEDMN